MWPNFLTTVIIFGIKKLKTDNLYYILYAPTYIHSKTNKINK